MSTPGKRPVALALALATAVMGLAGLARAQTAAPPLTAPVPAGITTSRRLATTDTACDSQDGRRPDLASRQRPAST